MMYQYFYHQYNWGPFGFLWPLIIVELILKGIALWKAARNNQLYWFIAIVIINSAGLLPLLYILFFQKKRGDRR